MIPLLRTKTTLPPVRPRLIERRRLLDLMNEGAQRALTIIVAPAGFGKTTLAAAWAKNQNNPTAWLSLQESDRSPGRFFTYLIHALQSIAPHIGQTSLALMQSRGAEGALLALVNDLAELETDCTLILDDYYNADCPDTSGAIQFILENRPALFHLIITTRVTPELSLARLRALDQVAEITAADLRFTPVEMCTFLESCMGLQIAADELACLDRLIEGWPVGLQLAGLALARQPAGWPELAGQEHIFEYLAEDVLSRETPEVQEFLKISALFDRFCAPLCDAIFKYRPGGDGEQSQKDPAAKALEYIDRSNLFLVPLDPTSTWYRYHGLFADFLRSHMPRTEALPLYKAASRWFEENDLLEDAIHTSIQAADFDRAAWLIEDHYREMLKRGEYSSLQEWIAAIPDDILDRHPYLWLAKGWIHIFKFDPGEAIFCIKKAETFSSAAVNRTHLESEAKTLHVFSSLFNMQVGDVEEIASIIDQLTEEDDFLLSILYINLGMNYTIRGEIARAVETFRQAVQFSQAGNNPLIAIICRMGFGETSQIHGDFNQAEKAFKEAIKYAKETLGEHTILLGMPYLSYAELLREQYRFEEALHYLEMGISYCQIWQPYAALDGHIALARLLAAKGNWNESYKRLDLAMQAAENSELSYDNTLVAITKSRLKLLHGDVNDSIHNFKAFDLEKIGSTANHMVREPIQMVKYRTQIMQLPHDPAEARQVIDSLSDLIAAAERLERATPLIEGLILRAYAHQEVGNRPAAIEDLSQALILGAKSGYVRIFADEGSRLLNLMEKNRPHIRAPKIYIDKIINVLQSECDQPGHHPGLALEGLTPLTRRELDILALIAEGKSNQEIADDLVLAVTTVKKHVANILSKMGVANRTQAGMLAKNLGWLD
jgi:LuxR family transcriptional regulator, maltose regulon positive regulatory protein